MPRKTSPFVFKIVGKPLTILGNVRATGYTLTAPEVAAIPAIESLIRNRNLAAVYVDNSTPVEDFRLRSQLARLTR